MAIVLSTVTHQTWNSPNLEGVVWRYRMPSPAHKAALRQMQASLLSDEDIYRIKNKELSEADAEGLVSVRSAIAAKWQQQRFMFASLVVGVTGILTQADGPELDLSVHRINQDVAGTPSTRLSDAIMADLEAGAVADDIRQLGDELIRVAGLSASEKKA